MASGKKQSPRLDYLLAASSARMDRWRELNARALAWAAGARGERAAVETALASLSESERRIIQLRFGTGGRPASSLRDAARELGVTQKDAKRLEERRVAWRALFADRDVSPVFVDLAAPDLPAVEKQFDALLGARH